VKLKVGVSGKNRESPNVCLSLLFLDVIFFSLLKIIDSIPALPFSLLSIEFVFIPVSFFTDRLSKEGLIRYLMSDENAPVFLDRLDIYMDMDQVIKNSIFLILAKKIKFPNTFRVIFSVATFSLLYQLLSQHVP